MLLPTRTDSAGARRWAGDRERARPQHLPNEPQPLPNEPQPLPNEPHPLPNEPHPLPRMIGPLQPEWLARAGHSVRRWPVNAAGGRWPAVVAVLAVLAVPSMARRRVGRGLLGPDGQG